jgi:glutaredoxin
MRFRAIPSAVAATAALFIATSAWAQLYRSVGPDGRVTYSDTPPTAASAHSGDNSDSPHSGAPASAALPYALAQTAQKYPVTLYTSPGCAPCDAGRSLLTSRGVPFTEKTISSNDDIAALKKIAGSANLPLLTIGSQQITGFQDSNWSQYLSAAGYPETSQMTNSYHRPPATPLAPQPKVTASAPALAAAPSAPDGNPSVAPPSDPNNPAGIRF